MITKKELEELKNVDLKTCIIDDLTDIRNVEIDSQQPMDKRMNDFISVMLNPYLFRVNDIAVKVRCAEKGTSFSDALARGISRS